MKNSSIDQNDCIMYFMMKLVFQEMKITPNNKLKLIYQPILKELIVTGGNIEMSQIFRCPTEFVYKGKYYPIQYDLEYAEKIFSKYQDYGEKGIYPNDWGHRWWTFEQSVMDQIHSIINYSSHVQS